MTAHPFAQKPGPTASAAVLLVRALAAGLAATLPAAPGRAPVPVPETALKGLSWRSIGPAHFSGRAADIAGVPGDPKTFYLAFASAGLFKTTNGGITFRPVLDKAGTMSIGAIALSPKDPNVVYVGTGEGNLRNSVSSGDGIYKSADGGETWTNLGLRDSERFSRIVVDPSDPNVVYAAALGHLWGPNTERGLFRSADAGATWKRVLYVDDRTGASDVALDPRDPKIVYCGMYEVMRTPWSLRSGGPGSGLYRSADGGQTWTKLTDPRLGNGLPGKKLIGRIGLAVAASDPSVVYAMIESEEPGVLWRSADRGLHWTAVSSDPRINNRPFYYTTVYADPADPDRVYALAGGMFVSGDGGRTWGDFGEYSSLFGDHHALWIDPLDPRRMINGNDGGFYLSNDAGRAWAFLNNMPSAQAYHVGVDTAEPYHVMGGFQDHEIWTGPSEKWNEVGVRGGDWLRLRDMADGMYALADPRDANVIYYDGHFGDITRIDLRNQEERFIQPYPVGPTGTGAHMDKYRFNWNAPIHFSPSDPGVIYYGGNVVFRTADGGTTWTAISPDLTTDDKTKQQLSGGPITPDNTKAEWYCTILSISESPLDPKVVWASTDDGNVQLTRDGGRTWTNLAPRIAGLPKLAFVASVSASPHAAGTAYIAVDQHRLDDPRPYAFMTEDFGQTWRPIAPGLRGSVHVVREDPRQPSLLYAGTELGIFASFDGGLGWTDLRLGQPPLPVVDLVIQPRANDLIIATHSRGFFILDDVTPLQGLAAAVGQPAVLFAPVPPVRFNPASDTSTLGDAVFVAPNKPYGAILSYYLDGSAAGKPVTIEVLDASGTVLKSLTGPSEAGINRVVWDLSEDLKRVLAEIKAAPDFRPWGEGFRVMPGGYAVRLRAGASVLDKPITVRLDPRLKPGPGDLDAYEQAMRRMIRMSVSIQNALFRAGKEDAALAEREGRASGAKDKAAIAGRRARLAAAAAKLRPPRLKPENLNLDGKLGWLLRQIGGFTGRPTRAQAELIDLLDSQLAAVLAEIEAALTGP